MRENSEGGSEGAGSSLPAGDPPDLEKRLGYTFRDRDLLLEALTHRSLLNEIPGEGRRDNERLEFLGDAILGLIVSEWLMQEFPEDREGELTCLRSALVQEKMLCEVSQGLELGSFMHFGKGEARMEGGKKPSVLADAFEALVGAVYLDGGISAARHVIIERFRPLLDEVRRTPRAIADPKSRVQELGPALFRAHPVYNVVEERGPEHAKTFFVNLSVEDLVLSRGEGKSKKEAEQDAAGRFLAKLGENPLGLR